MKRTLAVVVCVSLLMAATPAPKEKSDAEKLQGTWVAVSFEQDGEVVPPEVAPRLVSTFKDDTFTDEKNGRVILKGTFKLDSSRKPKAIDFTMTDEDNKGNVLHGIYEIDGDTLRLCETGIDNKERPADFVTKKDGRTYLFIFRREKPGKK